MNHYKAIIEAIKYLHTRGVDVSPYLERFARNIAAKTQEMFQRQLWSYALDFFRGDMSDAEFEQSFFDAISGQLTKAWNEGADEVGVLPEDYTDEDNAIIDGIIADEQSYVTNIGVDILDAIEAREVPGKITPEELNAFRSEFGARIDMWANRYTDVNNQAKLHFGGKEKLVWHLGATEKHCDSCSRLDGIVAYADEWNEAGIRPQSPPNSALICSGWNCDCSLDTTNERRTRDALGILMDIATSGNV
jgi:hypothetical protein